MIKFPHSSLGLSLSSDPNTLPPKQPHIKNTSVKDLHPVQLKVINIVYLVLKHVKLMHIIDDLVLH